MRNLKLSSYNITKVDTEAECKLCIDPVTKFKFAADCKGIFQIDKADDDDDDDDDDCHFSYKKWEDSNISLKKIVGAEVITSLNSVCVISLEGDVITANLEDGSVDVVGSVTDGITASGWSPDQEMLALVTGTLSIILMTVDLEPVIELSLEQEDFGESKFINVGWGKKETQFHGAEGKQAAKKSKKQATPVFEWDDRVPKITWRGDGQLFAVSYVNSSNVRKFRVVNREGIIQSTSEDLEGLEDCLCWKPSGNLIVSSQRLSNKHNIIFFEKNGLQHGGFTLPFNSMEMKIKEVSWNEDSSVLLVWLEPFKSKEESLIQLWKAGNYHWYLKEELKFGEQISDLKWDPEYHFLFHLITSTHLHDLGFISCVDISRGTSLNDNCQVAVIDGKKLLVTPFRQSVVPPPLSAYEVIFQNQIHSVIYAPPLSGKSSESLNNSLSIEDSGFLESVDPPGSNCNNFCVFHGEGILTFLAQARPSEQLSDFDVEINITSVGGNGFRVQTQVHRVISQNKLEWNNDSKDTFSFIPENLYNWNWVNKNTIVSSHRKENQNSIVIFDLEGIGTENSKVSMKSLIEVEDEVITISSTPDGSSVCLQLITGKLLRLNLAEESFTPWIENGIELKFPSACDQVLLCSVEVDTCIPLGLTSRNRLYLGNTQILSDCTSVHLHTDHVLITTTSHSLLVVPMNYEALRSLSQGFKEEFTQIGTRQLERGSRIVTAVPCDTKVLLQMPRGNLEMINPRPLAIHTLKRLLDEKEYYFAVDIMRRQRIDMNFIYDNNPEDFLTNIEEFIKSVNNPHSIDLFVASLSNSDVTQTAYSSNYHNRARDGVVKNDVNKIDLVCEALRKAMKNVDEEIFLLPILSTYVKSSKEEIHLALMKLKEMKNNDKKYKVSFEEGLRHLLYVADANELCDVALGTYDFELVMLVFEKSQKDPKEYLPFLNSLIQMEENYRKFRINVHLKRYKRALECITHCEEKYNEECLSLIKKECLYRNALEIFRKDSSFYYATCVAYGDYLLEKGYDNEAATMYVRGLKPQSALNAYEQANNWRQVLIMASQLKYNKENFSHLCFSLVEKLKSKSYYADAAVIYEEYIRSEEDAVECCCKANQWEEALLISSKYNKTDLIETNIKPGVLEHFSAIEQEIQEMQYNYKKSFNRLSIVRSKKKEEYRNFLEGKDDSHLDSDLYSDSSTVTGFTHQRSNISKPMTNATSASGKSYRSSKNKRKLDRKKYSTKEGSTFEDLGLIVALHELMIAVGCLADTVSGLNRILLTFAEDSKAKKLQEDLDNLIREMRKNKYNIWLNCAPLEEESVEFGPQMTTENAVRQMKGDIQKDNSYLIQRMNELEPHFRYPPNLDKISGWKLFSLR